MIPVTEIDKALKQSDRKDEGKRTHLRRENSTKARMTVKYISIHLSGSSSSSLDPFLLSFLHGCWGPYRNSLSQGCFILFQESFHWHHPIILSYQHLHDTFR